MTDTETKAQGFETLALHAGQEPDPTTDARAVPDLPDDVLRVRQTPTTRPTSSPCRNSATSTRAS